VTRCPACGTGGHARARHLATDHAAPVRVAAAAQETPLDDDEDPGPSGFLLGALIGCLVTLWVAWSCGAFAHAGAGP
jgi:hypothetical protein